MRRWASVLVESADATVVTERRDGLARSAQVKEEPLAVLPAAGDTEQNTPARHDALALTFERLHFSKVSKTATSPKATAELGACRAWGSSAAKRPQRSIFYRLFVP